MTRKHLLTLFSALLLAPLAPLHANELKLAGVFSDHMVLQREQAVPVWGWANPGEKVTVEFAGQKQSTVAGADGKWMAKLDAMKASDESRELTVQSEIVNRKAKISDVLVGDVWLASGQSNMDWAIRMDTRGAEALARCEDPGLRLYHVREQKQGWMVCAPETLGGKYGWDGKGFSSLAYFFGAELRKNLKCPIGLIQATIGGSTIESWMDPAAIETLPLSNPSDYRAGGRGNTGGNFRALIAPIIPSGIKGVIWYQGEGNGETLERAKNYALLLPRLIESWRKAWQQGDFPFFYVQLAAFGGHPEYYYPQLRESQQKTLALPMTGMATAIDLGNPLDDIHPAGKSEVGRRLSLLARRIAYGEQLVDAGPFYSSMKIEAGRIRIAFTNTGSGLVTGEPVWTYNGKPIPHTEKVLGFEIAGADGLYIPVEGTIDGKEVVLSSPIVPKPVAARYCWAMCPAPQGNLYNKEGLPAFPFRTDTTGDMPVAAPYRYSLSTHGMVFGVRQRYGWNGGADPSGLCGWWDEFGIKSAEMIGYWMPHCPVKVADPSVRATAYVHKGGKTAIALASWAKNPVSVIPEIDFKALGLDPAKVVLQSPAIRGFQNEASFKVGDAIPIAPNGDVILVITADAVRAWRQAAGQHGGAAVTAPSYP